jgi:hypothetical protein
MAEELKRRFTRARLAAIVEHDLQELGHSEAHSHVSIVPHMGYLVAIEHGDVATIRLVEEFTETSVKPTYPSGSTAYGHFTSGTIICSYTRWSGSGETLTRPR